jgi:hypothetical protein
MFNKDLNVRDLLCVRTGSGARPRLLGPGCLKRPPRIVDSSTGTPWRRRPLKPSRDVLSTAPHCLHVVHECQCAFLRRTSIVKKELMYCVLFALGSVAAGPVSATHLPDSHKGRPHQDQAFSLHLIPKGSQETSRTTSRTRYMPWTRGLFAGRGCRDSLCSGCSHLVTRLGADLQIPLVSSHSHPPLGG